MKKSILGLAAASLLFTLNLQALGPRLYSANNAGEGTISVFDTENSLALIKGEISNGVSGVSNVNCVAVDSVSRRVYVGNYKNSSNEGSISVFDAITNTLIKGGISTGVSGAHQTVNGIAVDPVGKKVFTANSSDGALSVFDTETNTLIEGGISGGVGGAYDVAVDSDARRVYTANQGSLPGTGYASISVFDADTNKLIKEGIAIGEIYQPPYEIAVDTLAKKVYTANLNGTISVFDAKTNTLIEGGIDTGTGGSSAFSIAVDPVAKRVYTGNYDGTVSVFNAETNTLLRVVGDITVSDLILEVAIDPVTKLLYTANGVGTISILNTENDRVIARDLDSVSTGGYYTRDIALFFLDEVEELQNRMQLYLPVKAQRGLRQF